MLLQMSILKLPKDLKVQGNAVDEMVEDLEDPIKQL